MENTFKVIIVILVAISIIYWAIRIDKNKQIYAKELDEKILSLKIEYENALKGTDKMEALKKGREYYSFLRSIKNGDKRGPSIYDEASMANDIATMNEIK
jgi:hypothetical protein